MDWKFLKVHSVLVDLFADLYIAKFKGDEQIINQIKTNFRNYVKEAENIIDSVCDDMYLCDDVLDKFFDIH